MLIVKINEHLLLKCIGYPIYAPFSTITIDISHIRATTAAIKFYAEQAAQRKIFDAIEKKNEEFRNATRSLNGVDVVADLSVDWNKCQNSVWESKCQESSFYERDCIHGSNCRKINGCNCTLNSEVKQNERRLYPGRKKKRSGGAI